MYLYSFSRRIIGVDSDQDFDLDGEYFFLFGFANDGRGKELDESSW